MDKKNGIDSLELRERNVELLKKYVESERKSEEVLCLIVKNNILMAKKMVKEYYEKCNLRDSIIDPEDLEQEAVIGIINAANKFDIEKGRAFSTYMFFWIKQKIIRSVQNNSSTIRIPAYLRQEMSNISKKSDDVCFHSEKVSKAFMAKISSGNEHENDKFKRNRVSNVDEEYNSNNKIFLESLIPTAKKLLSEREFTTVINRVLEKKTLQDISFVLGVTRERVRQIEKKAFEKLRSSEVINEFLM